MKVRTYAGGGDTSKHTGKYREDGGSKFKVVILYVPYGWPLKKFFKIVKIPHVVGRAFWESISRWLLPIVFFESSETKLIIR